MRYTAKARMLSFDFLPDDVVYVLPPMQALLLAGMVARADNLGRLPGDPPVLLAYLFFPKPPRPDATEAEAEALLTALASAVPPIVVWYQVGASRYVQFRRWKVHQAGLREHNQKSTLPGPDAEGSEPVIQHGQPSLFAPPQQATVQLAGTADAIRRLVEHTAGQHNLSRALGEFDEARAWAWIRDRIPNGPELDEWYKFARWLWNTGTHNMDGVEAVLENRMAMKPVNAYAYYAPGGTTRDLKVMQARVAEAQGKHEKEKKADAVAWPRRTGIEND